MDKHDVAKRRGLMRSKLLFLVIGAALAAAGLWVTSFQIQFNGYNQCGVNGCMSVSGSIPSVAPGMFLFVTGFIIAVYGLSRKKDEEDSGTA
jgi:hypothetical protein